MSQPDRFNEIRDLADALCDGEITPDQVTELDKLVGTSEGGAGCLLEYLQLHAELCWEHTDAFPPALPEALTVGPACMDTEAARRRRRRWRYAVLAASLLVAAVGAVVVQLHRTRPHSVARLSGTVGARWSF